MKKWIKTIGIIIIIISVLILIDIDVVGLKYSQEECNGLNGFFSQQSFITGKGDCYKEITEYSCIKINDGNNCVEWETKIRKERMWKE